MNRFFVQVVESGSLSAAARVLNTSVPSVARHISGLEALLGARLLNRTTRRQSLTEVGQLYHAHVVDVLERLENAKRFVGSFQGEVKGLLRVHLRTSLGNQLVVPVLHRFLDRHPDVSIDVTLTDERADLVALGIDLAVWLGNLEDSSMIARRLNPGHRVLCASPAYLESHGVPSAPEDLADHNCLIFSARDFGSPWRLTKNGETTAVPVAGNLRTNSGAALVTCALNGLGLVILQETIVRPLLEKGALIRVLADYDVSPNGLGNALFAVYPSGRQLSPKTRAFIDFLVELFGYDVTAADADSHADTEPTALDA